MMPEPVSGGVLDASVVIATILNESSLENAEGWFVDACISSVNLAEIVSKMVDLGYLEDRTLAGLGAFQLDIRPFTTAQAIRAGSLRAETRQYGLSLGDRACLALAAELNRPAITADYAWSKLDIGIPVELVR